MSSSNPSGLRAKAALVAELGPGIHTFSETHLSTFTERSFTKAIKREANGHQRQVRTLYGYPAQLRTNSTWAGTWTGVATVSDLPCQNLAADWPQDIWESSRVQITSHRVGQHTIVIANIYGFAKGPTWPQAKQLTNETLSHLTRQMVIGYGGLAAITGDFNADPTDLDQMAAWQIYGWTEVQQLAAERWNRPVTPTCKGTTQRDQIWLSPALAALCTGVHTIDVFVDHSTVLATFDIDPQQGYQRTWPRPASLPWHDVNLDQWQRGPPIASYTNTHDASADYATWGRAFEESLQGYIKSSPNGRLSDHQLGRAQRTTPLTRSTEPARSRPTRPGEEALINDLLGAKVHQWYKQLRRLQSFLHAIQAGQTHMNAVIYRAELWHAILRAKGFTTTFSEWWNDQDFATQLGSFPQQPPDAAHMTLIFDTFRETFRAHEKLHSDQRGASLREKYDHTMKALFHDLRAPGRDQIDAMWDEHVYLVLDHNPDDGMLHLDAPIATHEHSTWTLDGLPLEVTATDGELITTRGGAPSQLSEVIQRVHYTHTEELHHKLQDYWRPRWHHDTPISPDDLQRIVNFTQAFMPKGHFDFKPISIHEWRQATRRFGKRAARGLDGFGKEDLTNMRDDHIQCFLDMMQAIERGEAAWPQQLLEGVVISLAKRDDSHCPSDFRPIVLLSMLYRCWASIRSRQLLAHLANYVHEDAHGFLPYREPSQTWLQIQASVELALQSGSDLIGLSADVVKAFNNIRREPMWQLARHLGVPDEILTPWSSFLANFGRRFQVHNQLGDRMTSNEGYPEGCPFSVAAMAMLDWSLHIYQHQMAPQVRTFSFVDNINLVTTEVEYLIKAFMALGNYLNLWGLCLDEDKTYGWGTTSARRKELQSAGIQTKDISRELGGSMTFRAGHRTKLLQDKCHGLEQKWTRLRRSQAPLPQKIQALPIAFWADALHGLTGNIGSSQVLQGLRTKAVLNLGLRKAGLNSLLRLSLETPMTADPGFYQLRTTIHHFRRLCRKQPCLVIQWQSFHSRLDGRSFDGPFSALIGCFITLGWSISQPPYMWHPDGFEFNLLLLDNKAIDRLLHRAWLRHVAQEVQQRQTLQGLSSIDLELCRTQEEHLTAMQKAQIRALQAGVFLSPWQHAKFDNTVTGRCKECGEPDTQKHWLHCTRFAQFRQEAGIDLASIQDLPDYAALHLLAPESPALATYNAMLHGLRAEPDYLSLPSTGTQHLFTDGSHIHFEDAGVSLAGWGIINATTNNVVAAGHLPGLHQTIGRAELTAILHTLQWGAHYHVALCIWSDAASVVKRLQRMINGDHSCLQASLDNHDLWDRAAVLVDQFEAQQLQIEWIPSHLDEAKCDHAHEEWTARWNAFADATAGQFTTTLPPGLHAVLQELRQHRHRWKMHLGALKKFYLKVAAERYEEKSTAATTPGPEVIPIDDHDWGTTVGHLSLEDHFPLELTRCFADQHPTVHPRIAQTMIRHLLTLEDANSDYAAISFIELSLFFVQFDDFELPGTGTQDSSRSWRHPASMFVRPTLAHVVQLVRRTVRALCEHYGARAFLATGLNRSGSHIMTKCDGLVLRPPLKHLHTMSRLVAEFNPRGIRRACDIARPCL